MNHILACVKESIFIVNNKSKREKCIQQVRNMWKKIHQEKNFWKKETRVDLYNIQKDYWKELMKCTNTIDFILKILLALLYFFYIY